MKADDKAGFMKLVGEWYDRMADKNSMHCRLILSTDVGVHSETGRRLIRVSEEVTHEVYLPAQVTRE